MHSLNLAFDPWMDTLFREIQQHFVQQCGVGVRTDVGNAVGDIYDAIEHLSEMVREGVYRQLVETASNPDIEHPLANSRMEIDVFISCKLWQELRNYDVPLHGDLVVATQEQLYGHLNAQIRRQLSEVEKDGQ